MRLVSEVLPFEMTPVQYVRVVSAEFNESGAYGFRHISKETENASRTHIWVSHARE